MESDVVLKVEAWETRTSCVVWFFSVSFLKEHNDNNMSCSATVYLLHQVTVVVLLYLVLFYWRLGYSEVITVRMYIHK